ncbi:MAG: 1-acyl-sn-glycerol-3-phosphate acyltransferase [Cyanomargarita calcarea GSE-NOS-MK-12-04C]|uniref:1-acyl-sn-glycerol-3-phosphate acyltransferase n=1 Tax=Cyanomargarita calcarea GSE-NOS-MK-12-04C TaxID=2839659 RepID=A0A951UV71_9CYAN|nr:1-acyl-sn-glycerol-3-phosphate acyltransferase [Cyanomargarita calcarea GSE-NOS-MK-12-04C]
MPDVMYQAQPPLEFIPPALSPWFVKLTYLLLPTWIRSSTAITKIEADNVETLANLYQQFGQNKIRFLLAFRHPKVEDPLCLGYLLSQLVPRVARAKGIALQPPVHAHFIYDRGIPLWAGSHIGWIASHLGATPIQRGKADWTGLRSARDLFANGDYPIAAAPEGATNGLSEIINPLEPGIAQLGFWCAEDLHKAGRDEQVFILPVGIQYNYVEAPWNAIAKLLTELEIISGLPTDNSELITQESLYPRLLTLAEKLLTLMETFYTRFYHQKLPENVISQEGGDRNAAIANRLKTMLNVVLQVAEEYFDLQPKGNFNDRCRRVEQAGWNYIFREEFKDLKALSTIEKALGSRIAEEANLRMWHMRLVETFVAVTGTYIQEKPTVERFAETTIILWAMVTKIIGGNSSKRPNLGKQEARITIGEPISVSERYSVYKESRVGARQSVADLTKDLQSAFGGLI